MHNIATSKEIKKITSFQLHSILQRRILSHNFLRENVLVIILLIIGTRMGLIHVKSWINCEEQDFVASWVKYHLLCSSLITARVADARNLLNWICLTSKVTRNLSCFNLKKVKNKQEIKPPTIWLERIRKPFLSFISSSNHNEHL